MEESTKLEARLNMQVIHVPSPNCNVRREKSDEMKALNINKYGSEEAKIDILLLHYTECFDLWATKLFTKYKNVSSHYLINSQGIIKHFVEEKKRAWHAGIGQWNKNTDINTCSIGIEQVHPGYFFRKTRLSLILN